MQLQVTGLVYIDREKVKFPTTAVGTEEVKKVRVVNKDSQPHSVSHCGLCMYIGDMRAPL